jgi:hypothetical protein
MRRILIVLAAVFAGSVVIYGGYRTWSALLVYAFTRADPYPAFMTDYQRDFRSYEEAIRTFSDFVAKTFPIGSDEEDAISQITKGGFQVRTSTSKSVELVWNRHNGPCGELYSIVVSGDADGRIAKIAGELRPICL